MEQPDIMAIVSWCRQVEDPMERMRSATRIGDEIRDHVLTEIAGIRRLATVEARQVLIDGGMPAMEATRKLAEMVGQSTQTISRMIAERRAYGYEGV